MKSLAEIMANKPWAILPYKLTILQSLPLDSFFVMDKPPEDSYLSMDENGIATLRIHGVIGQRLGLFDKMFGGVSTEDIAADFDRAMQSPDVKGVILHIDSPGGMVDGIQELAEKIGQARGVKPIWAFTDGMMASGAYWVGSAAEKIFATPTSQIGSIGVVAMHRDLSRRENMMGVKTTYITSGKYKRMANQAEPLTDEGRAYIQEMVDRMHAIFSADVAANRKMSVGDVDGTEARIYLAGQARDLGLIDDFGNLNHVCRMLKDARSAAVLGQTAAERVRAILQQKKESGKTRAGAIRELWAEFPELADEVYVTGGTASAGA